MHASNVTHIRRLKAVIEAQVTFTCKGLVTIATE